MKHSQIQIWAYFCPDFCRRAHNELANLRQIGQVINYIDSCKRVRTKINNITDEEMLDRFIQGVAARILRALPKQDPPTFVAAC